MYSKTIAILMLLGSCSGTSNLQVENSGTTKGVVAIQHNYTSLSQDGSWTDKPLSLIIEGTGVFSLCFIVLVLVRQHYLQSLKVKLHEKGFVDSADADGLNETGMEELFSTKNSGKLLNIAENQAKIQKKLEALTQQDQQPEVQNQEDKPEKQQVQQQKPDPTELQQVSVGIVACLWVVSDIVSIVGLMLFCCSPESVGLILWIVGMAISFLLALLIHFCNFGVKLVGDTAFNVQKILWCTIAFFGSQLVYTGYWKGLAVSGDEPESSETSSTAGWVGMRYLGWVLISIGLITNIVIQASRKSEYLVPIGVAFFLVTSIVSLIVDAENGGGLFFWIFGILLGCMSLCGLTLGK